MEIESKFNIGDQIYSVVSATVDQLATVVKGRVQEVNIWKNTDNELVVWYKLNNYPETLCALQYTPDGWVSYGTGRYFAEQKTSFLTLEEALAFAEKENESLSNRTLLYEIQDLKNEIKHQRDKETVLKVDLNRNERDLNLAKRNISSLKKEMKRVEEVLLEKLSKLAELQKALRR